MHDLLSTFSFVFALTPILICLVYWGIMRYKNLYTKKDLVAQAIIKPVLLNSKDFELKPKAKIQQNALVTQKKQQDNKSIFIKSTKII
ncbi:hypothetical protein [Flexithrix dorotheae]|uniref:hypothetical protein n=1 Tax=Flexithrix dorotheae TaxID=70993 RepID=UPI0003680D19|nr:hypothetical protein [Flexithrix dorotheae]